MEKLICSCCTAPITPTIAQAFLTCEYCGTSTKNPYYDEAAAAEAAKPSLEEICLSALREMGAAQNLAKLDPDCFGDPINGNDAARMGLSISDAHQTAARAAFPGKPSSPAPSPAWIARMTRMAR